MSKFNAKFWEVMNFVLPFLPIELMSKLADPLIRLIYKTSPETLNQLADHLINKDYLKMNGIFLANLAFIFQKTKDERILNYIDGYKKYILKYLEDEYTRYDEELNNLSEEELLKYASFVFLDEEEEEK